MRPLTLLPPLEEVLAGAAVVALPLRTTFRGIDVREALLVQGPAGWGEFAPFTEYDDAESAPWLAAGLEAAWGEWPDPLRARVAVNATVPAVAPEQVEGVLATFAGCTTAKVKVAQARQVLADDVARVRRVRELIDVSGTAPASVRVDANGGWSVDAAERALSALSADGPLEYAEQPCASVAELVELRARLATAGVSVPIAADESIRRASDPVAVARAGAADVAVLKVAPLGGVAVVLALARVLREDHGMSVVISSALDTAVGIDAGLAAAAALPDEPVACGLGTGGLLAADVAPPRLLVEGALEVGRTDVVPQLLAAHAASAQRRAWWVARLRRCYALLAAAPPSP